MEDRLSEPEVMGTGEPYLLIWFMPQGNQGDTYTLTVRRPNGSAYGSVNYSLPEKYRYTWHWWYWNFSGFVSAADHGTWTIDIVSGPSTLAQHSFVAGSSTSYAPRLYPLCGRSFALSTLQQRDTLRVSRLGGAVTYALLNAPSYISLQSDSIVVINAANPMVRSSFFQAVATDGQGRSDTMWYHLVNLRTQKLSLTRGNTTCFGTADGWITARFGSGTGYQIRIDAQPFVPAAASYTFSGLAPGVHTIRLIDAFGGVDSATIDVNEPAPMPLSLTHTDVTCAGAGNGSITADFYGSPATEIRLDGGLYLPATMNHTFTNIPPGVHTVTIRTTSGCTRSDSVRVGSPEPLTMQLIPTDPSDNLAADGSIALNIAGGTPGYQMQFDGGFFQTVGSSVSVGGLGGGRYFPVVVRDSLGCETADSVWLGGVSRRVAMRERWNLVSIPLSRSNPLISNLFPASIGSAFAFAGADYKSDSLLYPGKGYWVKSSNGDTVTMEGFRRPSDSLLLSGGWNLVGTLSEPLSISDIYSDSSGITTSQFFGYAGGYAKADTLRPGCGYWLKASGPGWIFLGPVPTAVSEMPLNIVPITENPPPAPDERWAGLAESLPREFELHQNYPNPFNPTTVLRYSLPAGQAGLPVSGFVTLKVYNVLGQEVAELVDGVQAAGRYDVQIDATRWPAGVYFYQLRAGIHSEMKKMMLVK
jgi:hypothetical protein